MIKLSPITAYSSSIRYLDPAGAALSREALRPVAIPADADKGNQHRLRDRYRVDAAYRAYERSSPPPLASAGEISARKISSADLLASMIHQMGGAQTSSAKGAFVDISI